MRIHVGLISVCALTGLLAAVTVVQAQPASTNTAFDGTYRLVSSTRVNKSYTSSHGKIGFCPDRRAGSLAIADGAALYTAQTGYELLGAVGPHGELALKVVAVGRGRPLELDATGGIDANGRAHVRQRGPRCSYDFAWQK
jgi:hypothetical protein